MPRRKWQARTDVRPRTGECRASRVAGRNGDNYSADGRDRGDFARHHGRWHLEDWCKGLADGWCRKLGHRQVFRAAHLADAAEDLPSNRKALGSLVCLVRFIEQLFEIVDRLLGLRTQIGRQKQPKRGCRQRLERVQDR